MAQPTRSTSSSDSRKSSEEPHVQAALLDLTAVHRNLQIALNSFRNAYRMRPLDYLRFSSNVMAKRGPEDNHLQVAMEALQVAQENLQAAHDKIIDEATTTPSSRTVNDTISKVQVAFHNLLITIRKEPKTKSIFAQLKTLLQTVPVTGTKSGK